MVTSTEWAGTLPPSGDDIRPAPYLILEEFLAAPELWRLFHYAVARQHLFHQSKVTDFRSGRSQLDPGHRRSFVLQEIGPFRALIEDRLGSYLDGILSRLEIEPFPVASYEIQVTASNDGDFFNAHGDNHQVANAARSLSFVYFFHGEPRAFEGGQLVFHYSGREMSITPVQGVLVAFPPGISHEIRPVKCSSRRFADSRFTLNGWVRRAS